MSDLILINKTIYSWNSLSCRVANVPVEGVRSIDFSEKRERKQVKGMRKDGTALGKTAGNYTAGKVKVVFLVDTWHKIVKPRLKFLGNGSHGDAFFSIQLQRSEPGQGSMITDILECTIEEVSSPNSEGVEESTVEVTIDALYIEQDNDFLWSRVRSQNV